MDRLTRCSVCQKSVQPGLHGIRLECRHWNHVKCLAKFPENFQQCPGCLGLVDSNLPRYSDDEIDSYNGRDYIKDPLSDSYYNSFTTALRKEPFNWIMDKVPLDWIRDEKGYSLQRLIASGVQFQNFLDAGYTWEDLKVFKDFGDPKRIDRARQALFALKCNAEQLRDYPHLLGNMVQQLEINGRHLCELYGIGFIPNTCQPIAVYGGSNTIPWRASDLVKLGFKMTDLQACGLTYLEQYQHLEPTDADELAMEVKDEDVNGLVSVAELAASADAAAAAAAAAAARQVQQSPAVRPILQIPQKLPPVVVKYDTGKPRLHGLRTK